MYSKDNFECIEEELERRREEENFCSMVYATKMIDNSVS